MKYQRLHIRVPASGDAILLEKGEVKIETSVINVSVGGFGITAPSHLIDQHEYQVQVINYPIPWKNSFLRDSRLSDI